jgi:hypothetical protein
VPTLTSLLVWIEKGQATREAARAKRHDVTACWVEALGSGLFTIGKDGVLKLTERGRSELMTMRAQFG